MRTRVKICGITRPQDAAAAAELGVDAIGLNFVRGDRRITYDRASLIIDVIPPMVLPVALIGESALADDPDMEMPHSLPSLLYHGKHRSPLSTFQVYSKDPPVAEFDKLSETYAWWWWWVVPVATRDSLAAIATTFEEFDLFQPSAILLDTASAEKLGGTGKTFDWNWIAEARAAGELDGLAPIILAGGLTPDNVAEAIRIAQPYAVDVASGVEVPGKPGIKDPIKMRDFIQAAQGAS